MIAALALALAAQAAVGPPADTPPATSAAIRAAGKACVGTTIDPAGQDTRLAGWAPATPAQRGELKSDGQVLTRDNVLLIVKPGMDGGCVVMATADPTFDTTAFYADLGKDVGTTIVTDPKKPVTTLANGELLVTMVSSEAGKTRVMLVVGNPNGKYMKNKGN